MISLVIINFRSAALAADAVRAARANTSAPLEVVIVDNSCDQREVDALRGIADTLIVSETNRGYAGGINAGRLSCTGSTIVVSNPDVVFAPQALDLLAGALGPRVAVAGPALFWDEGHQWRLPPGELLTAPQKLDEILAGRSREWAALRDRRRIRRRVAFWSLASTTPVRMLSGAVLAIRAEDFDEMDGFDDRFSLYFEETDFLRRVMARRKRAVLVPEARCRHIYNQSAAQTGSAAGDRYADSELKYLEKWNGPFLGRVLKRLERALPVVEPSHRTGPIPIEDPRVLIELSPLASFATAAGHFPATGTVAVPGEVLASVGAGPLYLRVVDRDTARVLATYKITP